MGRQERHDPIAAIGPVAAGLFDASHDCVKIIGLNRELLAMNANGVCLMEIADFEALRGLPWVELWPAEARPAVEAAMDNAYAGREARFTADCPTAAGTPKSWEVSVWPVLDASGQPVQLISISRDITAAKIAEAQLAVESRELSHRIKNMFAVVDAVIGLSSRASPADRPFADRLRERLKGLGRAIAYVTPQEPTGALEPVAATLQGLLQVILAPYGVAKGQGRRLFIHGDDAPVGPGATTAVALIVNELATNALKYGALSELEGRVDVELTATETCISVRWLEELGQGRSLVVDPSTGFGSDLLENAVVRQLNGEITRAWPPTGLQVSLKFPLERLAT